MRVLHTPKPQGEIVEYSPDDFLYHMSRSPADVAAMGFDPKFSSFRGMSFFTPEQTPSMNLRVGLTQALRLYNVDAGDRLSEMRQTVDGFIHESSTPPYQREDGTFAPEIVVYAEAVPILGKVALL